MSSNSAEQERSDTLLAEIRHRLLNSFQMIGGLIRLRLRHVEDPEARRHMLWLMDMITAMGSLQSHLAKAGSSDFSAYLRETASTWSKLGSSQHIKVMVEIDEDLEIPREATTTLGLIAHELVTNCIEHGFKGAGSGTVRISLRQKGETHGELRVEDDGRGIGADLANAPICSSASAHGLSLMKILSSSLGGTFEIAPGRASGTSAGVTFPI